MSAAVTWLKEFLAAKGLFVEHARNNIGASASHVFKCSQHVACQAEWGIFSRAHDGGLEPRVREPDLGWDGAHASEVGRYRNSTSFSAASHAEITHRIAAQVPSTAIRISAQRRELSHSQPRLLTCQARPRQPILRPARGRPSSSRLAYDLPACNRRRRDHASMLASCPRPLGRRVRASVKTDEPTTA